MRWWSTGSRGKPDGGTGSGAVLIRRRGPRRHRTAGRWSLWRTRSSWRGYGLEHRRPGLAGCNWVKCSDASDARVSAFRCAGEPAVRVSVRAPGYPQSLRWSSRQACPIGGASAGPGLTLRASALLVQPLNPRQSLDSCSERFRGIRLEICPEPVVQLASRPQPPRAACRPSAALWHKSRRLFQVGPPQPVGLRPAEVTEACQIRFPAWKRGRRNSGDAAG